jgi:hypothetical protein
MHYCVRQLLDMNVWRYAGDGCAGVVGVGWGLNILMNTMVVRCLLALGLVSILIGSARVSADTGDCRAAIDSFDSARADLKSSLIGYANCIGISDGHDDCSTEFGSVQSNHDDFESAVSEYESACN